MKIKEKIKNARDMLILIQQSFLDYTLGANLWRLEIEDEQEDKSGLHEGQGLGGDGQNQTVSTAGKQCTGHDRTLHQNPACRVTR